VRRVAAARPAMESLSWIFKLVDSVSGPAGKMAKGLKDFGSGLEDGGEHLQSMGDDMGQFADETGEAVEAAKQIAQQIEAVAQKAIEYGKFVVGAEEFKKQTLAALDIIEGSQQAANDTYATIETMANNAGAPTAEVVDLYKQLRAAGFAAKDAENIIAAGLDTSAVFGKGAGEGLDQTIKQIKELGKFDPKNVKAALKAANIPAEELEKTLAKMKGVTVAQVKQMMAAGQISADEGINAILTTVQNKVDKGGPLGTATQQLTAGSLDGQLQTLKNAFSELFENGELAQPLVNALKTISDLLSANSETGKKLREILGGAIQWISDLLGQLLTADNISAVFGALLDVADALKSAFNIVWPYIKAIAGPMWQGIKEAVAPLIATFKRLFSGAGEGGPNSTLIKGFEGLGHLLGWIIGIVADFIAIGVAMTVAMEALAYEIIGGVSAALQWLGQKISEAASTISGFIDDITSGAEQLYDDAVDLAGNFIDGIIQGIKDGWDTVVKTVGGLGDAVVDTVKEKLGISSPSKVMAQVGMFTALGFAKGVNDNAGDVSGAIGDLAGAPAVPAIGSAPTTSASGSGRPSISIGDIVVHVPEGTKDPQAFGQAVGTEVRAQVLAILEELGVEVGALDAA
jgi:hypothetical protein